MIKKIEVYKNTRNMNLGTTNSYGLGVEYDNLIDKLYFEFDEMVESQATLLTSLKDDNGDYYAFPLTKEEKGYSLEITNALLTQPRFEMQLQIVDGEQIWHSKKYEFYVHPSLIVGQGEIPSALDNWIIELQEKIEEADNLNVDANKVDTTTTITITKKDGTTKEVEVLDGVSLENIEIDNRDLKVTYNGSTEDLGQIVPNIQVGTTTTGTPSSSASVENVGTDLNPILNFTIPKGEPGAIKFQIVQTLPTQDISEDTIYLVPYPTVVVQELPSTGNLETIYVVESTGKRYIYDANQWIEIGNDNRYIEYIYINNQWEKLGGINVDIDLSDYYTKSETNTLLNDKVGFTDYANGDTGGVIKTHSNYGISTVNGYLVGLTKTYAQYQALDNYSLVGKGTLENVISGKGLVSNTDYATSSVAGVVKGNLNAFNVSNTGQPSASNMTYAQYTGGANTIFISKGTLENVLTEKIGNIQTLLDNLNNGGGVE